MDFIKNLLNKWFGKQEKESKHVSNKKLKLNGKLYIGKRLVKVEKITLTQWKQLFGTIDALPEILIKTLTTLDNQDRLAYFVVGAGGLLDEIIEIVSVITGIEAEYIEKNASLDQIMDYLTQVTKYNNFDEIAKNVKSVLQLSMKKFLSENAKTM